MLHRGPQEQRADRFLRWAAGAAVLLLAFYVAQPTLNGFLFAAQDPRAVTARGELAPAETATIDLFARASPSVVHVFAQAAAQGRALMGVEGEGEDQGGGSQTGTGFVWDAAGHVVTNNHVVAAAVQGGGSIAVRLSSGAVSTATLVGAAPSYDLAVLRLGRSAVAPPPLAIGTSADLKVGQSTFAIGNPFGLDHTLTTGVISALQRRLPTGAGRELSGVIQTDAAINPGNSGGPLLDSAGRLIGVNTAIYSPSGTSAGIGFAIPVDVVNRVVPDLIRNGRTRNPGIGIIAGQEATAARLGIDGVVVLRVLRGSPAPAARRGGPLRHARPAPPRFRRSPPDMSAFNPSVWRKCCARTAARASLALDRAARLLFLRATIRPLRNAPCRSSSRCLPCPPPWRRARWRSGS